MTRRFRRTSGVILLATLLVLIVSATPNSYSAAQFEAMPRHDVQPGDNLAVAMDALAQPVSVAENQGNIAAPESSPTVLASSRVFKTVFIANADTYVASASPTTNYGNLTSFRIGRPDLTNIDYGLIRFDLSSLPPNAIILTATLELSGTTTSAGLRAYQANSAWNELSVTWNTRPSPLTKFAPTSYSGIGWQRWSVASLVQDWASGTLSNHGFLILQAGTTFETTDFQSRESAFDPRLTVYFTTQGSPMWVPVQADTWVNETSPSTNYNSSAAVTVAGNGSTNRAYTLLKFNLADLPANAAVLSATLELYTMPNRQQSAPQQPRAFSIYPDAINQSWNEATVTWNNKPAASNLGDPAIAPVIGWNEWDVTHIVDGWSTGQILNYGIRLRAGSSDNGLQDFLALPSDDAARLAIYYELICNALESVTISGVTQGVINTAYSFDASITPSNATPPITYTWQATGQAPVNGVTANFTWSTPGVKTITVTVQNCGGTVVDTHTVNITTPPPTCPNPLTGLSLAGPAQGITATAYIFTATVSPSNATQPITYTWQATGKSPQTIVDGNVTTVSYTWTTPGLKTITVAAHNCGSIGGASEQHLAINIVPRSQLPDLVISTAWYEPENGRVGYLIKNIGGSSAPAGHTTGLYRSVNYVGHDLINQTLPAGSIRDRYIPYTWTCAGSTEMARLLADNDAVLDEKDETNNLWLNPWPCDMTFPRITSGPTVDQITEHTARVNWQTDEPTRSEVRYSNQGYAFDPPATDANLITNHHLTLTGLETGRAYRYQVSAIDQAGNTVNIAELFFQTAPTCTDIPIINNIAVEAYPDSPYEFYTVRATLADAACTEKVNFYFHGELIGTDYATDGQSFEAYLSPYQEGLASSEFFGQQHGITAQAYNLLGQTSSQTILFTPPARPAPMLLNIVAPPDGKTVFIAASSAPAGTNLLVKAYAAELDWKCTWDNSLVGVPLGLGPVNCNDVDKWVSQVKVYFNSSLKHTFENPGFEMAFTLPLDYQQVGEHTLKVCAIASDSAQKCLSQSLYLEQGQPDLELTRTISRVGNYFKVEHEIKNLGTVTARLLLLYGEYMSGFMPADTIIAGLGTPELAYYRADEREAQVRLPLNDGSSVDLSPGGTLKVAYPIVPILYETQWADQYKLGTSVHLEYRLAGVSGKKHAHFSVANAQVYDTSTGVNVPIAQAVADALRQSDYVIVTNPQRLLDYLDCTCFTRVYSLMTKMAHLAYLRNGVLGFVDTNDVHTLDNLIDPRKHLHWTASLNPNFQVKNQGYVLIVGETEVMPSSYVGGDHFTTYPGIPDHVYESDLWLADHGGTARPELALGRLIGDDVEILIKSLDADTAAAGGTATFDRSHALLVSGRGDGVTSHFIPTVNHIAGDLGEMGINATVLHWYNVPGGNHVAYFEALRALAPNQDVIFYYDHGNIDMWGDGLYTDEVWGLSSTFGDVPPVTVAVACLAGNYERDDDYNIAEDFMRYGAGAYIGSTEISERETSEYSAQWFMGNWPLGQAVGVNLNNTKIAVWDTDGGWEAYDHEKLWAFEYNLYGDPKYGMPWGAQAATPEALVERVAVTTLPVHVPAFEVTEVEGYDRVSIPGGLLRLIPGRYQTPYWALRVDYPAGQRIQGVSLTALSSPVITTGLHLITSTPGIDCTGCNPLTRPVLLDTEGWAPDLGQKYDWLVEENADGSSLLLLWVYPFFYNVETHDVLFYQDFTFNVDLLTSSAQVIRLETDKDVYHPGETVAIELGINNPGAAQDIWIETAIKTPISERVVEGLPLQVMSGMTGTASLALEWNTTGAAMGDYMVELRLLNTAGALLDSEVSQFRVGAVSGEVTGLSVTPQFFRPGNDIAISMTFRNTGDTPITGTAVTLVKMDGITTTARFTHTITAVAPGATCTFNDTWNTTAITGIDYSILAYVQFNGMTTETRSVNVSTVRRLYLPTVMKALNP